MLKVFMGFVRQLAVNYREGRYDDRDKWASRLAYVIYNHLLEEKLVFAPDFTNAKSY